MATARTNTFDEVVERLTDGEFIPFESDYSLPPMSWLTPKVVVAVRSKGRYEDGNPIYYGFVCAGDDPLESDPPQHPVLLGRFEPNALDAAHNVIDLLGSLGYWVC